MLGLNNFMLYPLFGVMVDNDKQNNKFLSLQYCNGGNLLLIKSQQVHGNHSGSCVSP